MRALVTLLAVFSMGCGTLVHGPKETLFVDSRPAGAEATVACNGDVRATGTTPARLVFPRKAEGCTLTVSRPGYRQRTLTLEHGFSGWFWANFAIGPALAAAVRVGQGGGDLSYGEIAAMASPGLFFLIDHFTGSKHNHSPDEITVALEPAP